MCSYHPHTHMHRKKEPGLAGSPPPSPQRGPRAARTGGAPGYQPDAGVFRERGDGAEGRRRPQCAPELSSWPRYCLVCVRTELGTGPPLPTAAHRDHLPPPPPPSPHPVALASPPRGQPEPAPQTPTPASSAEAGPSWGRSHSLTQVPVKSDKETNTVTILVVAPGGLVALAGRGQRGAELGTGQACGCPGPGWFRGCVPSHVLVTAFEPPGCRAVRTFLRLRGRSGLVRVDPWSSRWKASLAFQHNSESSILY